MRCGSKRSTSRRSCSFARVFSYAPPSRARASSSRYGNTVTVETTVARVGTRSAVLHDAPVRDDGVRRAEIAHTVRCTDMRALASCDKPADVRAALDAMAPTARATT